MVDGIKVQLNRQGVREYLRSDAVRQAMKTRAESIAQKAGEGYVAEDATGKVRARAQVSTATYAARRTESKHGNLRKAIGGA